jgi:hypothetical protein
MSLLLGTQGTPPYESRPEVDLVDGGSCADDLHRAFAWMRRHEQIHHDGKNELYAVARHT